MTTATGRRRCRWKWPGALFLTAFVGLILLLGVRALFSERINPAVYRADTDAERYFSLPFSGTNFRGNSVPGYGLGRYYLKGKAAATVAAAYEKLSRSHPHLQYAYGEMGWNGGGGFWPHRTHRQGMSADFMTPVVVEDERGNLVPALLPMNVGSLWGYRVRLDEQGRFAAYRFDAGAMIAHLAALKEAGAVYGIRVKRVIFDPPLLKRLRADPGFPALQDMPFMEQRAWFPHDGHYHVDFEDIR